MRAFGYTEEKQSTFYRHAVVACIASKAWRATVKFNLHAGKGRDVHKEKGSFPMLRGCSSSSIAVAPVDVSPSPATLPNFIAGNALVGDVHGLLY